jgi:hypothetical protein
MDTTKTYTITRNGKSYAKLRFMKSKQGWYLKTPEGDVMVQDPKAAWEAVKAGAPKVHKTAKPRKATKASKVIDVEFTVVTPASMMVYHPQLTYLH